MKTIKFNNLVDKDGNTIEVEVPDHIDISEEISKLARLSATKLAARIKDEVITSNNIDREFMESLDNKEDLKE